MHRLKIQIVGGIRRIEEQGADLSKMVNEFKIACEELKGYTKEFYFTHSMKEQWENKYKELYLKVDKKWKYKDLNLSMKTLKLIEEFRLKKEKTQWQIAEDACISECYYSLIEKLELVESVDFTSFHKNVKAQNTSNENYLRDANFGLFDLEQF